MVVYSFYNRMVLDLGEVVDVVLRPLRGMQRRALERLLTTRLTLVWGPPGTHTYPYIRRPTNRETHRPSGS